MNRTAIDPQCACMSLFCINQGASVPLEQRRKISPPKKSYELVFTKTAVSENSLTGSMQAMNYSVSHNKRNTASLPHQFVACP